VPPRGPGRRAGSLHRASAIPEGIETSEQLERLRDLGWSFGQGYVFSPPVPADEIEWMLGVGEASTT
jgi:EAL domain-containing protein (putative c-di-GMP-specific phosphodiesterase class I)